MMRNEFRSIITISDGSLQENSTRAADSRSRGWPGLEIKAESGKESARVPREPSAFHPRLSL
jgi:hypothetical protein